MARSIAETPVLTGEDAIRFEKLRMEVESLTKEQRAENSRKPKKRSRKQRNTLPSACKDETCKTYAGNRA